MNTNDWLVASDIMAGVILVIGNHLQGRSKSNAPIFFVESVVYSVLGRFAEGKMAQNKGAFSSWKVPDYIATSQGRASLIIAICAGLTAFLMKYQKKTAHIFSAVSADTLADSIVQSLFEKDFVIVAAKSE
jgi:uncharacterized membrane protein YvlD (DUF360 family)